MSHRDCKVHVHSQLKDPAYPLNIPLLVKFNHWKQYQPGKIIIGDHHNIQIPVEGLFKCWRWIRKPIYHFVQNHDGGIYQLHLPRDHRVKLLNGRIWRCEFIWYSPLSEKRFDETWITYLVPDGYPTSLEEAMVLG